MRNANLARAALIGAVISLPVMAVFFLGAGLFARTFVVFDLFEWLTRVLPGSIVTAGIDALVAVIRSLGLGATDVVAKLIEQGLALVLFVGLGAGLGMLIALLRRRIAWADWEAGVLGGGLVLLLLVGVEGAVGDWLASTGPAISLAMVCLSWGALLGTIFAWNSPADNSLSNRRMLVRITAGAVATAIATWGLGWALRRQGRTTGAAQPLPSPPTAPPQAVVRTGQQPAPGTRLEVTPTGDFYRIDINLHPPQIEGETWELIADGLFTNPRRLTFADLLAYPSATQPITLSCISNPIGGDLIGTSLWTGVPLRDLVADLGLHPEATALQLESADGFHENVSMADMLDMRTLLVYGMNGATLPVEHGYPLRIYIPNRYGMKQPKWITHMEAVANPTPGYWVERGWSAEARPHIITIIDPVQANEADETVSAIGGIAWAGDRGISRVELQVDHGEWEQATLLTPPLSPLSWVLWRYTWQRRSGSHTFRARAIDGTGAVQIGEPNHPHPNGATGYHTITIAV